jgi:hypothetical protein
LRLDYEDYLRQHGLALWVRDDPRCAELVGRRCKTADEVAAWVKDSAGARVCLVDRVVLVDRVDEKA